MNDIVPVLRISPLRQRLIDNMAVRRFGEDLYEVRGVSSFRVMGKPTKVVAEPAPSYSVALGDCTLALAIDAAAHAWMLHVVELHVGPLAWLNK